MKKAFKLFFIYSGVLLLAFVATVVFCATFLFFYRDGNIFGFRYINTNEVIYAVEQDDMSSLNTIEINAQDFPVKVSVRPGIDQLQGAMRNKVFGYTRKSVAQTKFELEYNQATNKAIFNVIDEPAGWLNKKSAVVQIVLPVDMAKKGIDLKVNSRKGDITLYCEENIKDFNINNLTISSSKGDVDIYGVTVLSSVNFNVGKGDVVVHENAKTTKEITANLSVGTGKINLATKLDLDKFVLGVVNISKIGQGTIAIAECNEVNSVGNIDGGGDLVVSKAEFIDFTSKDTDVKVGEITGNNHSRIRMLGLGDVSVNLSKCPLTIEGYNGDIYVKSCTGKMILSANQGDIRVSNALAYIDVNSLYGKINIDFDITANSYDSSNQHRAVQATTKNGTIIINGLEKGAVTATGKGRISLSYNRIEEDNFIEAKSGAVYIVVPHSSSNASNSNAFNLKIETEVNSDIKVGVAGSIGKVDSNQSGSFTYSNIYNSANSTNNNLNVVSTTGIIKIRSTDLIKY